MFVRELLSKDSNMKTNYLLAGLLLPILFLSMAEKAEKKAIKHTVCNKPCRKYGEHVSDVYWTPLLTIPIRNTVVAASQICSEFTGQ